jgi:hypothetical protein
MENTRHAEGRNRIPLSFAISTFHTAHHEIYVTTGKRKCVPHSILHDTIQINSEN